MSYYAGDFYRAGDYYRAGGIFSTIGNVLGGVLKTAGTIASVVPGVGSVTGAVLRGAGSLLTTNGSDNRPTPTQQVPSGVMAAAGLAQTPRGKRKEPGITGVVHRLVPGGHTGYIKAHRTMRVTNPKALKRAERRLRGFEKMAKRALRPLGLHVVRHSCTHPSHRRARG